MRICKRGEKFLARPEGFAKIFVRLIILGSAFLFLASMPVFSAETLKKESNSSISMPSSPNMPSLSTPSVGSGFYRPGRSDFYTGYRNSKIVKQAAKSSDSADGKDTDNSGKNDSGDANAYKKDVISAIKKEGIGNLSLMSNQLTAGDISSLDSMGLLGNLSGLFSGIQSGAASNKGKNSVLADSVVYSANGANSKALEQILTELSELKAQVSQNGVLSSKENSAFINTQKVEPKILRFNVNGHDLLSSFRKTFFSEQEADGTFLLTGDRKYVADGKNRSETFYFLFKTIGVENGITKYVVTPALSQDSENTHSFLYQLVNAPELTAQRTGNLVTLRVNEEDWKMDVLLSLDK